MKIKEIRNKSEKDLQKMLAQERNNLRELKFKVASKQHKNYKAIKETRKNIARIITVLKEKLLVSKINPNKNIKKKAER